MTRTILLASCLAIPLSVACTSTGPAGTRANRTIWPEINPGCQGVELIRAGEPVPFEYHELREFYGHWDEPDKNLRNWLVNKACAAGADAVIEVVEATGSDDEGDVIYNIHGTAVVVAPAAP